MKLVAAEFANHIRVDPNQDPDYQDRNPITRVLTFWARAELAADREHYDAGSLQYLFPFKNLAMYGPKPPNTEVLDPRDQDDKQDFQKQNIADFDLTDAWVARGFASAGGWDGSFVKLSYDGGPLSALAKAAAAQGVALGDGIRAWIRIGANETASPIRVPYNPRTDRELPAGRPARSAGQARSAGDGRWRAHRRREARAWGPRRLRRGGVQQPAWPVEQRTRADEQSLASRHRAAPAGSRDASGAAAACRGRLGHTGSRGLGLERRHELRLRVRDAPPRLATRSASAGVPSSAGTSIRGASTPTRGMARERPAPNRRTRSSSASSLSTTWTCTCSARSAVSASTAIATTRRSSCS